MLQMRPNCECCDTDLPPDAAGAMICSFECTFCAALRRQARALSQLRRRAGRPPDARRRAAGAVSGVDRTGAEAARGLRRGLGPRAAPSCGAARGPSPSAAPSAAKSRAAVIGLGSTAARPAPSQRWASSPRPIAVSPMIGVRPAARAGRGSAGITSSASAPRGVHVDHRHVERARAATRTPPRGPPPRSRWCGRRGRSSRRRGRGSARGRRRSAHAASRAVVVASDAPRTLSSAARAASFISGLQVHVRPPTHTPEVRPNRRVPSMTRLR